MVKQNNTHLHIQRIIDYLFNKLNIVILQKKKTN